MSSDKIKHQKSIKYGTLCHAAAGNRSQSLSDSDVLGYFLTFATLGHDSGNAFVIFLDRRKKLLRTIKLKKGDHSDLPTVIDSIGLALDSDSRIKYFLLVHNHKNRPLIPSPEDIMTTDVILRQFRGKGARFLGHYITSGLSYILLAEDEMHIIKPTNFTERSGITE